MLLGHKKEKIKKANASLETGKLVLINNAADNRYALQVDRDICLA